MNAPLGEHALALLAQLEADAEARVLTRLSAKDEVIVLHPIESGRAMVSHTERGTYVQFKDDRGATLIVHRRWREPESWIGSSYMAGVWHPAIWDGELTLVDADGRHWQHKLPSMVMDDFGSLVPAGPRA